MSGMVRGLRYRVVVEGFLYANGSGYMGFCTDIPLQHHGDTGDDAVFGKKGKWVEIPHEMLVGDWERINDYPPGTMFEYRTPRGDATQVLVYDDTISESHPWQVHGSSRRLADAKVDRRYLTRLYRAGE